MTPGSNSSTVRFDNNAARSVKTALKPTCIRGLRSESETAWIVSPPPIPFLPFCSEDAEGLGYTNRIAAVGGTLFVTGHNSQLYRRDGQDWVWLDREMLPKPTIEFEHLVFGAIAGPSVDDLYMTVTCMPKPSGRKLTEEEEERAAELFDLGKPDEALAIHHAAEGETRVMEGRLYHRVEDRWRLVATPRSGKFYSEQAVLSDILIENNDRIWAVGNNGVILVGNARDGFQDISFKGNDENLRSITKFRDRMVIASDYALHWFDGHIFTPQCSVGYGEVMF